MENTNTQLLELKEKISRQRQAAAELDRTKELLELEQEILLQYELTANKEYEDVLRLEGKSLASLFHSFLGNRVEKLYEERKEYLSAKLKYEGHKETVTQLEDEIGKQEKQVQGFGDPEAAYEYLIQSRQEELKARNDPEYLAITGKMETVYLNIIELEEAVSAGKKASQGLSNAIRSMKKAKGWGTFDMLGGGLIATAVKHSHIDNAKSQVQDIQFLLKRFKRELQDVKSTYDAGLNPDISGFDKVIDFFFDNLIFDWVVQNRIHRSLNNLVETQGQVDGILLSLKKEATSFKEEYRLMKKELDDFLERT